MSKTPTARRSTDDNQYSQWHDTEAPYDDGSTDSTSSSASNSSASYDLDALLSRISTIPRHLWNSVRSMSVQPETSLSGRGAADASSSSSSEGSILPTHQPTAQNQPPPWSQPNSAAAAAAAASSLTDQQPRAPLVPRLSLKVHPNNATKTAPSPKAVDDATLVRIANADRLMWYMTDEQHPMVVNATVMLDRPVDRSLLVERSRELVQEFPILSCRISEDFRWTPVFFDAEEHSTAVTLSPSESVNDYLGKFVSMQIGDFDKPMWSWTTVSKPDTNEYLIMIRIHHVIGDGVALMTLLNHLLGKDPVPVSKKHLMPLCNVGCGPACVPDVSLGNWKIFFSVMRLVLMTLFFPLVILNIVFLPRDKRTVLTQKSAHKGRVTWWSRPLSHETITKMGASINGTVNDTCCAIISGALQNYLAAQDPRGKKFRGGLKCIIPVSVRSKKEAQQLNNRVGALFVRLPVSASSPRKRLKLCKWRMDMLKLGPSVPITMLFIRLTTKLLDNRLCTWLNKMYSKRATLIFSNVLGTPTEATLLGSKVEGIMGFVPLPGNMSLGITVISYAGTIRFGLVADPLAVTDHQLLGRLLEEEYTVLMKDSLGEDYVDSTPRTLLNKHGFVPAERTEVNVIVESKT